MTDDEDLIARLGALPHAAPFQARAPVDVHRRVTTIPSRHRQVWRFGVRVLRCFADWNYAPVFKFACLALLLAGGFALGQWDHAADNDPLSTLILGNFGTEG